MSHSGTKGHDVISSHFGNIEQGRDLIKSETGYDQGSGWEMILILWKGGLKTICEYSLGGRAEQSD